jgi:CRP/FNR family cyclic AMP-dependent transcriptional regulator
VHVKLGVMPTPYGIDLIENCEDCGMRKAYIFCGLSKDDLQVFESLTHSIAYPEDTMLFAEDQMPRGVFVLCRGRVKLSLCSHSGKTLIMKIAEPGEILGLSAAIRGNPYQVSAETLDPSQLKFVRREDFLHFLREHSEASLRVAHQLSEKYMSTCREMRTFALPNNANAKLARLLLDWSVRNGGVGEAECHMTLSLTHHEIAQMIGMTRETVTRTFAELKKRQILRGNGPTLVIRNKAALRDMASAQAGTQCPARPATESH